MNPKPLSSLNHLTVPVAIGAPPWVCACEMRRMRLGNDCKNAGTAQAERLPDQALTLAVSSHPDGNRGPFRTEKDELAGRAGVGARSALTRQADGQGPVRSATGRVAQRERHGRLE